MKTKSQKFGFTIIELLVVVSIIGLLLSLLIPAVGKARDGALTTQSSANLRNLATACAAYAGEWNDRQPTFIPDDFGANIKGAFDLDAEKNYIAATGSCPPSMIAGYGKTLGNCSGGSAGKTGGGFGGGGGGGGGGMKNGVGGVGPSIWGMWTQCESMGMPKNWGVAAATPMVLGNDWGESVGMGAWRMSNSRSFNQYVGGKFYDKVFYSPKDKIALDRAQPAFEIGDDFTMLCNVPGNEVPSTYVFSPSAMYSPDVFSSKNGCISFKKGGLPPATFRSPSTGQTAYPELKTRMIEHSWLQNKEGPDVQPNFKQPTIEPYYFNHCINSQPASLFCEGHIALPGCSDRMDGNVQVMQSNMANTTKVLKENGLFASSTLSNIAGGPWGDYGGYYTGPDGKTGSKFNYDEQVNTSFHVFTVDGIQGRDFIVAK